MQPIHEIRQVENTSLTLILPKEFINKMVEVTVVPVAKHSAKNSKRIRLQKIYDASKHHLSTRYKFNRDEIHER